MFEFLGDNERWPECGDPKDWDTTQKTDLISAFEEFEKWDFSGVKTGAVQDAIDCPICHPPEED